MSEFIVYEKPRIYAGYQNPKSIQIKTQDSLKIFA